MIRCLALILALSTACNRFRLTETASIVDGDQQEVDTSALRTRPIGLDGCLNMYCKAGTVCVPTNTSAGGCVATASRPGKCPTPLMMTDMMCIADLNSASSFNSDCTYDAQCTGGQKCCRRGCRSDCIDVLRVDPLPMAAELAANIVSPCAALKCAAGTTCTVTSGGAPICSSSSLKAGQCPILPPGTMGSCLMSCSEDADCTGTQKCCSNGCGKSAGIVHSGQCPPADVMPVLNEAAKSKGALPIIKPVCPTTCQNDATCSTAQKCCATSCGGRTCQTSIQSQACNCAANQVCVMQQVQCIRAPCPPIPACVDKSKPTGLSCGDMVCAPGLHCLQTAIRCSTGNRCPAPPPARCVSDDIVSDANIQTATYIPPFVSPVDQ